MQAYQKRCPFVIDWLVDLARRSGHRLMVRLVKGAYWDGEIKRAQVDGLDGFPVFTRKIHTDVSYLACARKLLAATDVVYPQFATHNAQTLATIYAMAGDFRPGQYEFQCLHGMGETLYEQVVGPTKLDRPCRIYAPVGTHETLLAYLVRRLLENGANTSFVNQIADKDVPIDRLVADPVSARRRTAARRHAASGDRRAARPVRPRAPELGGPRSVERTAARCARRHRDGRPGRAVARPAAARRRRAGRGKRARCAIPPISTTSWATSSRPDPRSSTRPAPTPSRGSATPQARAECLERVADRMEARMPHLIGLIVREAGKTFANAVGEVREAVDFLRYYASQVRGWSNDTHKPLGVVACISPWNFPLSIFTGQVAAALAAGNAVIAKPAEETPLIAAQAVRLFLGGGLPPGTLQLAAGRRQGRRAPGRRIPPSRAWSSPARPRRRTRSRRRWPGASAATAGRSR